MSNKRKRKIIDDSSSEEYNSSDDDYNDNDNDNDNEEETFPDFELKVKNVNTLQDLIKIAEDWNSYINNNRFYQRRMKKKPRVQEKFKKFKDFAKLSSILDQLYELNNMIGLSNLKRSIVEQILFFIQNLQGDELMHTVLIGFPGCGKTTVGKILGSIYKELGILSKGTFMTVKRSDFIGKYLGHTADKTQRLLNRCKGGIMFLDEAYSLGPKREDADSFSKEAIDTLNQFLSENNRDFICIIAGYEKELQECFFSKNPGLERRFPWKFTLDKYSPDELYDIFVYQISSEEWFYEWDKGTIERMFQREKDLFSENGGDCKILFDKCKIAHAKRIFGLLEKKAFLLTEKDFTEGFKVFKEGKAKKKKDEPPMGMYN